MLRNMTGLLSVAALHSVKAALPNKKGDRNPVALV